MKLPGMMELMKLAASGGTPEQLIGKFLPNMLAVLPLLRQSSKIADMASTINSEILDAMLRTKEEGRDLTEDELTMFRDATAQLVSYVKGEPTA